jgi:class 3 adenylate cyclase
MGEYEVPGISVAAARGAGAPPAGELGSEQELRPESPSLAPLLPPARHVPSAPGTPTAGAAVAGPRRSLQLSTAVAATVLNGASPAAVGAPYADAAGGATVPPSAQQQPYKQQQQQPEQEQKQEQQPHHKPDRLRVYTVLPACLAARAKVWGSSLSLKEGWRQTDRGFFDAPGAVTAATLTPRDAAPAADAMPRVTMVFACVEGAKWLVRWRHAGEVREMARLLRMVLVAALRAVPGGYLCREQEGGLRYMLAFGSAEAALQWCLLVQEALMYAPWPAALLALPEFGEQHTPDGGTLLFRGPRVKMGVCEGRPRSLVADHVGRADYFGASVNQAARYMDAAAHGGQVACELDFATAVFRWARRVAAFCVCPHLQTSEQRPPRPAV